MPQVPGPATDQGITRLQGTPNVRVSGRNAPVEAFGGGEVAQRATAQFGNQVMQMAREEKAKADDVATMEAYAKTVQLRNRLMYDPKSGAMNRKGKDAFGVGEEYGAQFAQGADEIEQSLTNDDQRAMYQKIRMREGMDLDQNLTKHTFQEARSYEQQTFESTLAATREDAVMNYQDPGKVQAALSMQKTLVMEQAQRMGMSPEAAMMAVKESESKTHEGVLQRMLANGQDLAASDYYKNIKGSLTAEDTVQVERALEEGTLRGESQRQAMAITSKHGGLQGALAEVDKIQDPKIQDATRDRVKQRFAEREQAKNYAQEQAFHSAYSIAEKTRSKDDIPPGLWASMSPQQKSAVDAYLAKDNIATDWGEYYNLKTMAGSPQLRDKFLKTDLMEYRHKLGDSEFKELVNAQNEGRKGKTDTLDGFQTDQQIVNGALSAAGIDPTPNYGSKDAKRVDDFRRRVDQEVKKMQEETGKKVTNEQMDGIVNNLLMKVTTHPGYTPFNLFKTEKRLYELDPRVDKEYEFNAQDIPKTERQKIESALRSKGYEVSEQSVMALYSQKIKTTAIRGARGS